MSVNASDEPPVHALHVDLNGVRALPLLSDLGDFGSLDGRLQSKIDVQASGNSQNAVISSLAGTADVRIQDGQILGINVAKMIRTLTARTLLGWEDNQHRVDRPHRVERPLPDPGGQGPDHESSPARAARPRDRLGHHRPQYQDAAIQARSQAGREPRRPGRRRRSARVRRAGQYRRKLERSAHLSRRRGNPVRSRRRLCQAPCAGAGPVRQGRLAVRRRQQQRPATPSTR